MHSNAFTEKGVAMHILFPAILTLKCKNSKYCTDKAPATLAVFISLYKC
jgi:hypothetical protein